MLSSQVWPVHAVGPDVGSPNRMAYGDGSAAATPLPMDWVLEADVSPVTPTTMRVEDFDTASPLLHEESADPTGQYFVDAAGRYSVLVHLDPVADRPRVGQLASDARRAVRDFSRVRNLDLRHEYEILPNTLNLRGLTQEDIDALARIPGVARVELDELKHINLHDSIPLIRGLETQKAAAGHSARGNGTRVCIIDTGINAAHIMFTGKIDTAAGWDYYNNDSNPADDQGHGSNVAGIAAGLDGLSVNFGTCGPKPFQGVAPGATIIAIKVCSSGGSCPTSAIVAGINRCASPTLPGGPADVINLSLGGGQFSGICDSDTSAIAANNAVASGVTVVAAAGNNGFANALGSPACGSQVIAVGAVYDNDFPNCQDPDTSFTWCLNSFCSSTCTDSAPVNVDERICFSNRSVNLDVSAPGGGAWSAGIASSSSIIEMFGTSQASPHVAGLVALILGEDPSLTPAEVRQILRDGAVDLGSAGFDSNFGWGRIDVIDTLDLVTGGGCQNNGECDDGAFCNGAEVCNAGSCQAGAPPNCSDGVACTTDSCNESTDSCNNTPNNGACDDGLFCNGSETCHATFGCQAGTPPNCNDGVACTTDSCNEGTDSCNNTPNNGACDDGLFCNGGETCHATLDCQAGTPPNCNDGVACTIDSCNESTDSCDNVPNDTACDDGQFCNGAETCNGGSGCVAGSDPCPGQSCDEGTDSCVACIDAGDCDDGLFCNGAEVCNAGTCQAGSAPNCNDGIACTIDSCNEGTDSCDHAADNAACEDGQFCNGAETCNVATGCVAGSDPCDPGDTCDEGGDECIAPGGAEVWISFVDAASVPGVGTVQNEDIVAYDLDSGTWSLVFDGSDVGLGALDIDAVGVLDNGDILISFSNSSASVAGLIGGPSGNTVDDSDIVRFTPTSLGSATAGTFNFYFDGSDVGLTTNAEDIDAIAIAPDGRLVISTLDAFSVTGGSGQDEDLIIFTATSLGSVTAGSWATYFDGSDVGLSNSSNEDVDAASIAADGGILLSTLGNFSVPGLSGADEDVFEFAPTLLGPTTSGTYSALLDLSALGIATGEDVNAVELVE